MNACLDSELGQLAKPLGGESNYRTGREVNPLLECIRVAYTGRAMKSAISSFGLSYPMRVTDMYLGSEPPEYILAAVVAVNQAGE